jgi:hypothetical protein
MRTPVRALPAWPQALLDGRGKWPLPFAFLAATALDLSFTTFLDAALALPLPFDFLRVAIDVFPLEFSELEPVISSSEACFAD